MVLATLPSPSPLQRDAYIRHVSSTEGLAALAAAVVRNASSVLKARLFAVVPVPCSSYCHLIVVQTYSFA